MLKTKQKGSTCYVQCMVFNISRCFFMFYSFILLTGEMNEHFFTHNLTSVVNLNQYCGKVCSLKFFKCKTLTGCEMPLIY